MTHLPDPFFNAPGRNVPEAPLPRPSYDTPKPGPQREKRLRPPDGIWERLKMPGLLRAMWTVLGHLWRRKLTLRWPEEVRPVSDNYRGLHRLNKDRQGRMRCVACLLCQAACPADCIRIEAAAAPWPDRETCALRFNIDQLRCIYCGMCEEACPQDAIELTRIHSLVGTSRRELIFDKEQLLALYDLTRDEKHPSRW